MDFNKFKETLQKIIAMFSENEIDHNFIAEKEVKVETDDYWSTIMSAEYHYEAEEAPW